MGLGGVILCHAKIARFHHVARGVHPITMTVTGVCCLHPCYLRSCRYLLSKMGQKPLN